MKKNKQKSIVKESKKLAKKELTKQLIVALTTATSNISVGNKKVEKLIAKNAKQLAKKLSGAYFEKPAPVKPVIEKTAKSKIVTPATKAVKKEEIPV